MDNLNPPRVLIESNVVGLNESVRLDTLFQVFDPDNNSQVTEYQIRDSGNGGGFFTQNGVALTPTFGEFIVVPGNEIGTIEYVGGSSIASESINIRAFDGAFFSDLASGLITTGNSRPVLTANNANVVVAVDSRTSIADLVSYSDAENNPDRLYFIVDRSSGFNSGQLITFQDDIPNPQATFLLTTGFELAGTTYEAPSIGGASETISIRAFDGFSWSEIVDFTITTSVGPIIIDNGLQEVITNQRTLVTDLFSLDANAEAVSPAQTYFFVDRNTNAGGGFFEFQGVRQTSGEFFKVEANELDQVVYVGASSGTDLENIGIVAFDGVALGETVDIAVQTLPSPTIANNPTVRAGHFLNFETGGTANIGGTVPDGEAPIFDFLDSGANIIEYLFADRSTDGGHFLFNGVQVPSAQFFLVRADELDQVEYVGGQTGPTSEDIGVLVNTNFVWNQLPDFTINTIPNINAPVVTTPSLTVNVGTVLSLESLFDFTDAEGDSLQSVSILDTDPGASTGFFTINGVQQQAETSILIPIDQVGTVNYVSSSSASSEDIQITVNDGLLDSIPSVATITSIEVPVVTGAENDISIDTIERVLVSSLVNETASGPGPIRYQVFDENSDLRSGGFEINGVDLQRGAVLDLTAAQFSNLTFRGAEVDLGRQLDPIIIRADDGNGFGEWERVNINTDPVGTLALVTPNLPADNIITYSFIDGGNQGGGIGPAGPRSPFYYVEDDPAFEADMDGNLFGLSQPQRETFREALEFYERVANLEYVEIPYRAADTTAEIVIGAFPQAGGPNIGFQPDGVDSGTSGSDIFFNSDSNDFDPNTPTDVSLGSEFRSSAYSLIAFTLGLNTPDQGIDQLSIFNNFDYLTVTSNQRDSVFNPFDAYPEAPSSLALYDVERLQEVYGANTTHNIGNNQYGNFFSGSDPHFVDNNEQHQTILYDAGGTDTLNYTLHVANETIDLRQGQFSSINGVPQSLRISYDTVIENARGGSGNDNIRGNETNNFLFGNDGNDVLRGGGGDDTLRGGAGDDTYVWSLGDGNEFVQEFGNGGLDTLQVFDPSGSLSALEDDLVFRRFGNDLRIDFTFNQGPGQGSVFIDDFGDEASRIEFLTIHNAGGTQIGNSIDLQSIFDQATTLAQRFTTDATLATTIPIGDDGINENASTTLPVS